MRPLLNTASRSHRVSASSWSWVTIDEGDAELALDCLEFDLHLLAQLEVEGAERLVEEQHLGPTDQRPGQGNALPLAAGELGGLARPRPPELDHVQGLRGPSRRSVFGTPLTRSPYSTFSATVMCGNSA